MGKVELCSMINLEVARMAHENLRELEDQLIELRQTYQEVISETREFETHNSKMDQLMQRKLD